MKVYTEMEEEESPTLYTDFYKTFQVMHQP